MVATTKKRTTKKVPDVFIHECLHEDRLNNLDSRTKEIHEIITGNGAPDKGLVVQMVKVNLTQIEVLKTLSKLDNTIEILNSKYNESIFIANTAKHAIETYKKEINAFDDGKTSEQQYIKNKNERIKIFKDLQHSIYTRWITTIAVVIAALTFIYNTFIKEPKYIEAVSTKIDNLGVPITVTRSGKLYSLPDTVSIKMFKINENISDSIINN